MVCRLRKLERIPGAMQWSFLLGWTEGLKEDASSGSLCLLKECFFFLAAHR